ncbi:HlyD family secretion protein [Portibacter lacus]|uniref:Biotin attachment protein n=1 Tax=Portibacter lacus TaxID=1099794 RepID=A0AA37SUX4_9BACT|nr:HlyD family efflux transporter periplasmic adaptor subunit [Portibacter lacus]GLR19540.1 biotin attachment protein [Portibacter lacus]
MLNISENSIKDSVDLQEFNSYKLIRQSRIKRLTLWLSLGFILILFLCLFLPWTQNISAKGYVTTRSPEQRPQGIQSVIAGRLEEWYVQEGDFVEKGDTIVFISEVKSEYFDPELLARTTEQINAKSQSIDSYSEKESALVNQYIALQGALKLKQEQNYNKIKQARNKISMDSIDLIVYKNNYEIATNQLSRTKELYDKGLKTLSELQEKENKNQAAKAKVSVQENKLLNQRNELVNLTIEIQSIENDYADKLAKSQSEKQSAVSAKLESVAATSKLRNQYSNYSERQKFYYITAPQSGYITKTLKKGIGETVKEGIDIATIMPSNYKLAVEIYARPQDIPLLSTGETVQLRFDGWPAIVISGWPESSTGVFSGTIVALDKFINENGYYRILISPNIEKKDWPEKLSIGTGVNAFILLKKVPIWYEVWRQLNGFPPDFYTAEKVSTKELKRKAPLKSVK